MTILPRLIAAYEKQGFVIRSGLNPAHFGNYGDAPFTYLWRDGVQVSGFGGISLHEVMVMEAITAALAPATIYVIGNAWGWATVALAMMAPDARVIAVDPGYEPGTAATEAIAAAEGLSLRVLRGASPAITPAAAEACGGGFDLVLIDGDHTVPALMADMEGVLPWLAPRAIVVCHDVVQHNMLPALKIMQAQLPSDAGRFAVLERTASGMAVFIRPDTPAEVQSVLDCFHDPVAGIAIG